MAYKIIHGNSADILKQYPDNHFDSVVCDPPYGISFLGKDWDKNTGDTQVYKECYRVLKPGGHLLAFSAARTYHHLAMTVETVGFEIRDQIMWIYGSGFPKSQDIGRSIQRSLGVKKTKPNLNHSVKKNASSLYESGHLKDEIKGDVVCTDPEAKAWEGWGTQLKPAHEPIVMARKPMKDSIAKNVQQWGTGAINVDATRIGVEQRTVPVPSDDDRVDNTMFNLNSKIHHKREATTLGRFPANVILDQEAGEILDSQAPKVGNLFKGKRTKNSTTGTGASLTRDKHEGEDNGVYDGLGGASRFFYCPKVSRSERHTGFDPNSKGVIIDSEEVGNNHPTVKPVELMKYLIKLVTPPGGTVLDPFNGSGSTCMAAVELDYNYVGIEMDEKYVEISNRRIQQHLKNLRKHDLFEGL